MPEGSVVANEHWDDALPFSIDGKMSFKPSGTYYGLTSSSDGQMQMYGEDTPEKREQLYQWLNEADYIVQSSNRLWGSIPRLPMRYPMSTEFYKLLAEGKLGWELAGHFTSFPTIFGIPFDDTWAEEAFSVYDHPEVRIYRKTPAYSEGLARSYFDKIDLENTIMMWPKQISQAPTALMLTKAEAALQQAGGTWSQMFDVNAPQNRSQVLSVVVWLLVLELLGSDRVPAGVRRPARPGRPGLRGQQNARRAPAGLAELDRPSPQARAVSTLVDHALPGAADRRVGGRGVAPPHEAGTLHPGARRAAPDRGGDLPGAVRPVPADPGRQPRSLASGARGREADGVRLPQRRDPLDHLPALRPVARGRVYELLLLRLGDDRHADQADRHRAVGGVQPGRADAVCPDRGRRVQRRLQPGRRRSGD